MTVPNSSKVSESDNFEELRSALYEIPPNLGDLYRRALSRKVRRTFSKDLQNEAKLGEMDPIPCGFSDTTELALEASPNLRDTKG